MLSNGRTKAAAATVLGAVLLAGSARANGPEIGSSAGGVVPLVSRDVQLVEEYVKVVATGSDAPKRVHCVYRLRNLSDEDRDLSMAFYDRVRGITSDFPTHAEKNEVDPAFRVLQDGRALQVRSEKLDRDHWLHIVERPVDRLPVWDMSIDAGAETQLVIDYDLIQTTDVLEPGGHRSITFHARPARLWAGVIERATIEFHVHPRVAEKIQCRSPADADSWYGARPRGYTVDGNVIRWVFEDWEPDTDPTIVIHHRRDSK